jgi:hypothetical protein
LARSRTGAGLTHGRLDPPASEACELFRFAGAWAPPPEAIQAGWGAWSGDELVAAVLLERSGEAALIHGPVLVSARPGEEPPDPDMALHGAAELLAHVLQYAAEARIETLFARPQGLDRLWVRLGFLPVPEAACSPALRGRPGAGLYGWRGGSALWSAAGRGAARTLPRSG